MKVKNVIMKDFSIGKNHVNEFEIVQELQRRWHQPDECKNNDETFLSIIYNNKEELNKQLTILSDNIASERLRTLNNVPKMRVIGTRVERYY